MNNSAKTYIERPADKFLNVGHWYQNHFVVIRAIPDGDGGLQVIEPADFKWPHLLEDRWLEIEGVPGPISDDEYARLVLAADDLPEWICVAARELLEER